MTSPICVPKLDMTLSPLAGGRAWCAHLVFTRMTIGLVILRNQTEEGLERVDSLIFCSGPGAQRGSHSPTLVTLTS